MAAAAVFDARWTYNIRCSLAATNDDDNCVLFSPPLRRLVSWASCIPCSTSMIEFRTGSQRASDCSRVLTLHRRMPHTRRLPLIYCSVRSFTICRKGCTECSTAVLVEHAFSFHQTIQRSNTAVVIYGVSGKFSVAPGVASGLQLPQQFVLSCGLGNCSMFVFLFPGFFHYPLYICFIRAFI